MDKSKVAVLGGGAVGHAAAADLTLRGFTVNLYELPQFVAGIKRTVEAGEIEVTGAISGVAKINMITTDIKDAIKGIKTIFVMAQSKGDALFAEACAPYVEDGQIIILYAGNCGSLVFANIFKDEGVKNDVVLAESTTSPYGCRFKEPTHPGGPPHVRVVFLLQFSVGVFPAKRTNEVVSHLKKFYVGVTGRTNVLEAGMSSMNPVLHCLPALLNIGCAESAESFSLYAHGFSKSVVQAVIALNKERDRIFDVLGWQIPRPTSDSVDDLISDRLKRVQQRPLDFGPMGPLSEDRFITEDVPYGLVTYSSFGKMVGVETPTIDAAIQLASVINEVDYMAEGRTATKLGVADMSIAQLNEFLYNGEL